MTMSVETVTEAPADAGAMPHTGLHCLVAVAAHHGIATSVDRLVHEHVLATENPNLAKLAALARAIGLKARVSRIKTQDLTALDRVFPLMVGLKNGNTVVIAGIRRDDDGVRFAVFDPLVNQPGLMLVPEAVLLEHWTGEVVFAKARLSLTDENQPFGLLWFIPELLRQKAAFRDIGFSALSLHVLGLLTPIFFQLVIDKVLVHHSLSTLHVLTVGVLVALIFEAGFTYLRQYLLLFATRKVDIRLSSKTFSHLLALPIDYFERTTAGVTVRHMQQVEKIRQFLTGRLFSTILDSSALFVFLPVLFFYSAKLTFVVLLFTAAIAGVVVVLIRPFRRRLQALYNAEAERQAMLVETIQGMRTVKSLATEPYHRKKWDQKAANSVRMHFRVGRISASASAITHLLEKAMMVAVIAVGAGDVFDQTIGVGALIAFQMLAQRVTGPLVQIVTLVQDYQETALSVRMLGEVMNRAPERRANAGGLRPRLQGNVELSGITFRYGESTEPALKGIDLSIPAGALIGVVGRSGSGKSTLTRLLQGLYSAQQGVIRLDGIDVREIDLAHLRRNIGVVLQENFLFRGTVRENICMTQPEASPDAAAAAARLAGADEFIERLPQGFDTILEENAANLSGGQRQRLAIARALLTRPRILILDEATSALDPDSEAIFMDRLSEISSDRTTIIVSHRLSTLVGCHKIAVLDLGRLIDMGTHTELLSRCDIYRHLWQQQNRHL